MRELVCETVKFGLDPQARLVECFQQQSSVIYFPFRKTACSSMKSGLGSRGNTKGREANYEIIAIAHKRDAGV